MLVLCRFVWTCVFSDHFKIVVGVDSSASCCKKWSAWNLQVAYHSRCEVRHQEQSKHCIHVSGIICVTNWSLILLEWQSSLPLCSPTWTPPRAQIPLWLCSEHSDPTGHVWCEWFWTAKLPLFDHSLTHTYPLAHLLTLLQTVPSVPTLLHCAALTNQGHIVDYLRQISYPPTKRCKRIIDEDRNVLVSHTCFNLNQWMHHVHRLVVMN